MTKAGRLLALMGIPGCGKSTLAATLESALGITMLREPEESAWPGFVKQHMIDRGSAAATFLYFRSMRVEQLVEAARRARGGITAGIDSYYDKLLALYIDDPAMQWFFDADDLSFGDIRRTAVSDYKILPDADDLIFISITLERWKLHLDSRGRGMDKQSDFKHSFALQDAMMRAAEGWSRETGARLYSLRYDESADENRTRLIAQLREQR